MKRRRNLEAHQLEAIGKVAELSIKTTFLVNGGSCIALLAFLGDLTSVNYNFHKSSFIIAGIAVFTLGVLFVSYASGATYLAQIFFFSLKKRTPSFKIKMYNICLFSMQTIGGRKLIIV